MNIGADFSVPFFGYSFAKSEGWRSEHHAPKMSKVCQLFSGSSGNSIYISSQGTNVLVDIGVSAKRCENALMDINVDPSEIHAIFITHEHTDHVAGVRVFASRYGIPVFAPPASLEEMFLTGKVTDRVNLNPIQGVVDFGDILIEPFALSHDSADCVGYKFNLGDQRKVAVCTDTGCITNDAREMLIGSDLVFLESNHEVPMVETGSYPYMLKKRILSNRGHLSNGDCAQFVKELVENGTTRIVLSHLSRENNVPNIARLATTGALCEIGAREDADYRLYVSPPANESRCIVL